VQVAAPIAWERVRDEQTELKRLNAANASFAVASLEKSCKSLQTGGWRGISFHALL
jgi:hypothetical protein